MVEPRGFLRLKYCQFLETFWTIAGNENRQVHRYQTINFYLDWIWCAPQSSFSSGKLIKFRTHLRQLKPIVIIDTLFIISLEEVFIVSPTKIPAARSYGGQSHDEERQDEEDKDDPWDDVHGEDGVGVAELTACGHDDNPCSVQDCRTHSCSHWYLLLLS